MKLTHLGHACLLLETDTTRVLVDPGTFSRFDDVEGLDAVLVTHQHADHCDPQRFGSLMQRSRGAALRTDPETSEQLRAQGLDAEPTRAGDEVRIGELTVRSVGERHAHNHDWVPGVDNVGLVITAPDDTTLFHPGDALDADPGPVDWLGTPVNAPWCAVRDTLAFVRRLRPARGVVPIHDGLLAPAGREMYLKHIGDFGLDGGVEVLDTEHAAQPLR